jgi:hypothetical protein
MSGASDPRTLQRVKSVVESPVGRNPICPDCDAKVTVLSDRELPELERY